MAFTTGNDTNILQGTDSTFIGAGLGNDRYILAPSNTLSSAQTINITDTGAGETNTLQLIGGLTIKSSTITSTSARLVLSNDSIVNITGANTFSYEIGGDPLMGTAGTIQNFSSFATVTLGIAAVPTGTATATNTISKTIPATTTTTPTTPTLSFESTTATVTEGNSGTTNMTFTVKLSAAQTSEVKVDYAATSGTATSGSDFTPTSGTLTFAVNETSKTITVPITVDTTYEANETFTVALSNAKLGGVVTSSLLGTSTTATGTITNDDANSAPVISVIAGPSGTPVPSQVGAQTSQGLFGDFTVTDADTTSLIVTITAPAGLVAITSSLVAYSNNYTSGTNASSITLTGSAANLTTALDTIQYTPGGAVGSTDTLTVTVNDGSTTSTQTVAISVAGTYKVTAGNDNLVGTASADMFLGADSDAATATHQSVGASDTVSGSTGNDILRFPAVTGTPALVDASNTTVTSIESIEIATKTGGGVIPTLSAKLVGGLTSVIFTPYTSTDGLTVTDLSNTQTVYVAKNTGSSNATMATLTVDNKDAVSVAGTQSVNVSLNGGVSVTSLSVSKAEEINIASTGSANTIYSLTQTSEDSKLNITGSQNLTILASNSANDITDVVATNFTGVLTFKADRVATTGTGVSVAIAGGSGSDLLFGWDGNDVISGGAGNDFIAGVAGTNNLTGGDGVDVFGIQDLGGTSDVITDFTSGTDKFYLSSALFSGLGLTDGTAVQTAQYEATLIGATATTTRIIYNSSTGALSYDPDGSATTYTAIQFATLANKPATLTASDFVYKSHWTTGDLLTGSTNADTINDTSAADKIIGGAGSDTINLTVDSAIDTLILTGTGTIASGAVNNDTISNFNAGTTSASGTTDDVLQFGSTYFTVAFQSVNVASLGSNSAAPSGDDGKITWISNAQGSADYDTGAEMSAFVSTSTGSTMSVEHIIIAGSDNAMVWFFDGGLDGANSHSANDFVLIGVLTGVNSNNLFATNFGAAIA